MVNLNDMHVRTIVTITVQILALYLVLSVQKCVIGAQINKQQANNKQSISIVHSDKTADLTVLINETLAINNKTLASSDKPIVKDDWTFDMVEYDLMEFLQDLSARYKMSNRSQPMDNDDDGANATALDQSVALEAKRIPDVEIALKQSEKATLSPPINKPTPFPQLSTSLASGDHDIAESTWQYGIFDRFTRPKTTSTTKEPQIDYDSREKFDLKNFNSEECGLRTYSVEDEQYFPQQFEQNEAAKELNQRRQRPPLGPLTHKKYQIESVSNFGHDRNRDDDALMSTSDKEAYESYNKHDNMSYENHPPSSDSLADNEFNLSSRRHWLQQQLGNTLQLLGFNASSQSAAEFLNQTSGLSLNMRENMMKMSGKFGKSVNLDLPEKVAGESDLIAGRQDELKLEPRVIGGSDARLGDSPWSVSLQALVSRPGTGGVEYRHYCGGTIISEHYVLTAAHCLDFMVGRESRLFVVIGDLNWRMNAASLYGRRFGIEKLIIHSGYKSTAFGHDIGLIRTKESMKPLKVNGKYIVNSVCLPEKGVEHSGEAELVGWGLFSNRNEMADSLQIADVPILPRPLCVDLYRRRTGLIQWLIGIELITEKQVCAGTFGRGICQGDSGSALVFNEKIPSRRHTRQINKQIVRTSNNLNDQTRATIIGIVAFGGIRRCSYQSLPGVYMQTSKYMDWILPRIQPSL